VTTMTPRVSTQALSGPGAAARFVATGAGSLGADVRIDCAAVFNMLGFVPDALLGALAYRVYALTNHHKRSVLAHNQFPTRRGGQKFIGAMTRYYGRRRSNVETIDDVQGESFAFSPDFDQEDRFFEDTEFGRTIRASSPMAIPWPKMRPEMRRLLGSNNPEDRPKLTSKGFLYIERGFEGGKGKDRWRSLLLGWLRMQRKQRPILRWYAQWQSVLARDWKTFEAVLDKAGEIAAAMSGDGAFLTESEFVARFGVWEQGRRPRVKRYYAQRQGTEAARRIDPVQPVKGGNA